MSVGGGGNYAPAFGVETALWFHWYSSDGDRLNFRVVMLEILGLLEPTART